MTTGLLRRSTAGAVLALLAGALVVLPLSAANATSNGIWSMTPPPGADGVVADSVVLQVQPGAVITTPVTITNLTNGPLTVRSSPSLSPVAAANTTKGTIDSNEATKWLSIDDTEVSLGPRGSQPLQTLLRVPTNAESGDYAAQLLTFGAPVQEPFNPVPQQRSVALRFTIRVGSDLKPNLELSTVDVQGQVAFFRLTNTGNTILTPVAKLDGTATDGKPLTATSQIGEMFPGETRAVQVTLPTAPKDLTISVASDAPTVKSTWPVAPIGAAVLTPGAAPPPPPDPGSGTAALIVFTLVGLFLVLLMWWAIAVHRRRKRRAAERMALIEGARLAEQRGEAAAAAAVADAAAAPPPPPPALGPGDPFPPPSGAPVEALTLAAVAAGLITIPAAGRPSPPQATNGSATNGSVTNGSPDLPAPGTPFPPPTGSPVASVDPAPTFAATAAPAPEPAAPALVSAPSASELVGAGVPFPPPSGAPVG